MAIWLGTSTNNVTQWLKGRRIPAWVVMTIFDGFADIKAAFLSATAPPVAVVDPVRQALEERVKVLLDDDFMFNHLQIQIGICEGYQRERLQKEQAERIVRELQGSDLRVSEVVKISHQVKAYEENTTRSPAVRESKADPGTLLPSNTDQDRKGSSAHHRKGKIPGDKK